MKRILCLSLLSPLLWACEAPPPYGITSKDILTTAGAVTGGVAGASVGGGNGAVAGVAAGAAAGMFIGNEVGWHMDKAQKKKAKLAKPAEDNVQQTP